MPWKSPNQYGDILLFGEGRREREAVGDMKKREEENLHARRARRLQKSPAQQGVGYRRFTPPSTSPTAKGLKVLGLGWRGILPCAEVGRVLSGDLMPFKPLSLGLTGALLPPPGLSPAHNHAPLSSVVATWQALPEDSAGLCAWWFLQSFEGPPLNQSHDPTTVPDP